jgi:hypothetical protein
LRHKLKKNAAILPKAIDIGQITVEFMREFFYKRPTLALVYYHCCSVDPRALVWNDELGTSIDNSATWDRISDLIGDPIGQKEAVLCRQTFKTLDRSHAKNAAFASCCECLLRSDEPTLKVHMKINDLPSAFLLTDKQVKRLNSLASKIVEHHVQLNKHGGDFYHLNPDLVHNVNEIVLCPVCAKDPMTKNQESIAAGNDYGQLAYLKPLNRTTHNPCVPVRLYNINLQICENHALSLSLSSGADVGGRD